VLRQFKQREERFYGRLSQLRRETNRVLAALARRVPEEADIARLQELAAERAKLFEEYSAQAGAFVEHVVNVEKSIIRRPAMPEQRRPRPSRSQAKIEELSEELTTKLRLERIDDAVKEVLAFIEDRDFFAANATTARRRRLRSLQTAIEAALVK
jgi:hypothetical protein